MGKIKGWTQQYDSGEKLGWRGNNTASSINIRKDGDWNIEIILRKKNSDRADFVLKQFKLKKEALKFVMNYMRNHQG